MRSEGKMYETDDKMVSHPPHYQSESGLEAIDVIEAFTSKLKGIEAVDTGNVLKYMLRWKEKNGLQDLNKAMWYLQHLITHLKKVEDKNKQFENHFKNGDVLMSTVCGACESVDSHKEDWVLADCEKYCDKYSGCEDVAIANDILKMKEGE